MTKRKPVVKRNRRDPLFRVKQRPDPAEWGDDEPMMLVEAAALFFPDGPLTISSFRNAAHRGELAVAMVAGKFLTTPAAVREMLTPQRRPPNYERHVSRARAEQLATERGEAAKAALKRTLAELRAGLRRKD